MWKVLSRVQLFVTPWAVDCQAPLSMEFSRQEYWSGLPFPSPGDLPNPGIKPRSPTLQADSLPSVPPGKPINAVTYVFTKWQSLGEVLRLSKKIYFQIINYLATLILNFPENESESHSVVFNSLRPHGLCSP